MYPSHPQTGSYSFVHTVSIEISLGFMQSKEAFPFLKIYVIYEIVKLFQGDGDVTDVIGLICITIFLFVILPLFDKKSPKDS